MAPTPAAAAVGGCASKSEGIALLHTIKELQAGLPLLQQPSSDELVLEVGGRLQASFPTGQPAKPTPKQKKYLQKTSHSALLYTIVEILTAYLAWAVLATQELCLPGTPPDAVTDTKTSSSSSIKSGSSDKLSSNSSRATSSSSSGGGGSGCRLASPRVMAVGSSVTQNLLGTGAPPLAASVIRALWQLRLVLQKALSLEPEAAAALQPLLLTKATGTLEVLCRVAQMQTAPTELQPYQLALYSHLIDVWTMTGAIAFPHGLSSSDIWEQLPNLADGLPAISALLHCYLRLPASAIPATAYDVAYVQALLLQLQALLRKPGSGLRGQSPGSSPSLQPLEDGQGQADGQRGGAAAAAAADAAASHAGPPNQQADLDAAERARCYVEHRAPVEHFLWALLATTTAALQAHPQVPVDADAPAPASTSTTSNSSSCSSDLTTGLNEGAGYPRLAAILTWHQALALFRGAAGLLHSLALADTPRGLLLDMQAGMEGPCSLPRPGDKQDEQRLWRGKAGFLWRPSLGQGCCTPDAACDKLQDGSSSSSSSSSSQVDASATTPPGVSTSSTTSSMHNCSGRATGSSSSSSSGPGATSSTSAAATGPSTLPGGAEGSSSSSSGGSDTMAPSSCPGGSVQQRAHTLSAAVAAQWRVLSTDIGEYQQGMLCSTDITGDFLLVQLLLLLVQHLQRASAQGAFLHTPAGGTVLQVLSEVWDTGEMGWLAMWAYVCDCFRGADGVQAHVTPPGEWMHAACTYHDLVHLLVLPGLLLQPAPPLAAVPAAAGTTTNSSSSSSRRHDRKGAGKLQAGGDSSSSDAAEECVSDSCGVCCADQPGALGHTVVLSDAEVCGGGGGGGGGATCPLVVVPHAALQLPPGCTPPPAAFFLVEQLLRRQPVDTTLYLAVQLLRGCAAWVAAPGEQQQQQQQQQQHQGKIDAAASQQAAAAELRQLAYCSLASSVVQAVVHNPLLGRWCAQETGLLISSWLYEAEQAASEAVGAQHSSGQAAEGSCAGTTWSVPASLAAAAAAGAYTAHVGWVSPQTDGGSSSSSSRHNCTGSDEESARPAGRSVPGEMAEVSPHPENCTLCYCAARQLILLGHLERGSSEGPSVLANLDAAAVAEAAQWHGTSWQLCLQQQLLALAWRHPVPGVCGNVLCEQREGPSAAGAVRGRVGSRCGGCRAVQYCCEGCQRAAWAAHKAVCRGFGSFQVDMG